MSEADTVKVDPILLSIIQNRFEGIAEEMAQTLMMTSRSGIFAEARDFVTGICDGEGRLLAQSRYFPGFACALPYVVPPILDKYAAKIVDGDVFIVNDPYSGNSHLPDMNVLKPVFCDGRIAFWAVCKGHMADIGGAGVAGYDPRSETVYDEGVLVPPLKLFRAGVLNEDLLELIVRQLKLPELVRGDILCEVGGANIGERGLKALLARYGGDLVDAHVSAFLDASERTMRARLDALPDGIYYGEKMIDDDVASDTPLTIRVKVTVGKSAVEFDFTASDPQSPRYMNSTDIFARSMATLTLFWVLEHDQSNHGSLRPIRFINPKGTCANAAHPASTVLSTCTMAECIQEAVQLALAQALPKQTPAPSSKLIFPIVSYIHPEKKHLDVNLDFFFRANPSGGAPGFDGWPQGGPAQEMGMGREPDPEIHELTHPVRIHCFEQIQDSAGAGAYRGGNGWLYRVEHLVPSVKAVVFGSGVKPHSVPTGLFGGRDPEPSVLTVERSNGARECIRLNSFFDLGAGDILELRQMGGPGYGEPRLRDPDRVAQDICEGAVSVEKARSVYLVAVDAAGAIDVAATEALRR
jgi:N-methylhydantoinase B